MDRLNLQIPRKRRLDLRLDQQDTGISAVGDDQFAFAVDIGFEVVVANKALFGRHSLTLRLFAGGGTPDVEGSQRQLGTRFTDGLGGDDADRFTRFDQFAFTHVQAVTLGADAVFGFTGDRGADRDGAYARLFDKLRFFVVDQRTLCDQNLVGDRVDHVVGQHAAVYAIFERFDHLRTDRNVGDLDPFVGAAILHRHFDVLGDVDQFTGQVTGVGGFKGGVGQTFTRTVGGDEVLQYVETLFEVRKDRRFDDGTVRFGHQTPHTGQLPDLRRTTPCPGVGHHEDGVEAVLVFADQLHHLFGDGVVGVGPDVDDLVVALLLGQKAGIVLLLDFAHLLFRFVDQFVFGFGNANIVGGDGDARHRRIFETEVFQIVQKLRGDLQAAVFVDVVDQGADIFLFEHLVPHMLGYEIGQNRLEDQSAGGGVDHPTVDHRPYPGVDIEMFAV